MTKTLEDQMKEAKYWWKCSFCNFEQNEGTTSHCFRCDGVRTTA